MRKILILIPLSLICYLLKSQDIIVLKTYEEIQSKVIKISETEIEYKKFSNVEGPSYTEKIEKVALIKYQSGSKPDIFDKDFVYPKSVSIVSGKDDKKDSIKIAEIENKQKELLNKNEQLIKENKKLYETQRKQDSLMQAFKKQQDKKNQEIQDSLKSHQKKINKTAQSPILDSIVSKTNNILKNITERKDIRGNMRPIGVGFDFINNYDEGIIVIPINITKDFRFEPMLYIDYDDIYFFTLGFFGMYQSDGTNIYVGSRLRFPRYRFHFSPTVGVEYFISKHFSIGGEAYIECIFYKFSPPDYNTYTRPLLKFYF